MCQKMLLAEFELHHKFTDTLVLNMHTPGQTCWLSLQVYVEQLLHNWNALSSYFQGVAAEDPTHINDRALLALMNPLLQIQLEF